jgi:glycosyltransferase involved in cell wall biosynthesis
VLSVITRLAQGGSERRLYDVLAAVPAAHTVVVGGDSDPDVVRSLAASQAGSPEVLWCAPLRREVSPVDDGRALVRLVRLMRARRFSVVHTHQSKAGLLGRVAARVAGVEVVYHSASMASFGPGYGRAESAAFAVAERVTAPLVDRFFVVGDDLAERIRANGVAARRIEVVRSSLDLDPFAPVDGQGAGDARLDARARLGIDADARVVVYVGSLDERKNVLLLPDAVARAAGGGPVVLLVAGAGPLAERLRTAGEARTDGVEVRLLGHVRDVAQVMRAGDVLALPSSAEGLPQVLVQAARGGLPFVAFDVDGVAELLALGAVGHAVPLGDPAGFAEALRVELARPAGAAEPVPDDAVWAQWDPAVVGARYRGRYDLDLGSGPG